MRRKSFEVSYGELLYMREVEGLSNKEIAARCGCSVATVYKYLGARPKPPKPDTVSSVATAVCKAVDTNNTNKKKLKRSMTVCNSCANKGVACACCFRNPYFKDYFKEVQNAR